MEQRRSTQWNMPGTRLYAPTYGSLAYAEPEQETNPEETSVKEAVQSPRPNASAAVHPGYSLGGKTLIVFSVLMVTAVLLFVMMRYANIANAYSMVNTEKSQIETLELRLAQLNVDMQCAVDPQRAREVAQRNGMGYPVTSQYVQLGDDSVVFGDAGAQPTEAADGEELQQPDAADSAEPETLPEQEDVAQGAQIDQTEPLTPDAAQ